MNNNNLNKIVNVIIYILTIFLMCLIFYNLFLLFNKNNSTTETPKNSVKVSPISIEEA